MAQLRARSGDVVLRPDLSRGGGGGGEGVERRRRARSSATAAKSESAADVARAPRALRRRVRVRGPRSVVADARGRSVRVRVRAALETRPAAAAGGGDARRGGFSGGGRRRLRRAPRERRSRDFIARRDLRRNRVGRARSARFKSLRVARRRRVRRRVERGKRRRRYAFENRDTRVSDGNGRARVGTRGPGPRRVPRAPPRSRLARVLHLREHGHAQRVRRDEKRPGVVRRGEEKDTQTRFLERRFGSEPARVRSLARGFLRLARGGGQCRAVPRGATQKQSRFVSPRDESDAPHDDAHRARFNRFKRKRKS